MLNEIIPIWKPLDWTSFDVVKKIRNQIKPSKVGHAGSLDPFAEGVLVICTGKCTKKVESFMDKEKEYLATIQLGVQTDTLDKTGNILNKTEIPLLSEDKIEKVLSQFIGEIRQMPPMYSALKVNGVPLYKYARKGVVFDRKKRVAKIYNINLITFTNDTIQIKVLCGRGTYIRTLGEDIAKMLGTAGHLIDLKRIRIGEYDQSKCIKLNKIPEWLLSIRYQ
tara:strand:+ start:230 stop:895 length:666 start_codon:yes stop_codon:yes gene_type:complete